VIHEAIRLFRLQLCTRRLLAVVLGLPLTFGCTTSNPANTVKAKLEVAVKSGQSTFDFASAAPFAWDRVFVFGCYTSREVAESALGFEWPDFSQTSIDSSDSVNLVVFVRDSRSLPGTSNPDVSSWAIW
jgi:hypothetical protein